LIETLAIALVVGSVLALTFRLSIPALQEWLRLRRFERAARPPSVERAVRPPLDRTNGSSTVDRTSRMVSGTVATDAAFEAERRLADLKAELAAAETRNAELERQISVNLRKLTAAQRKRTEVAEELAGREAALAQRERILEQSLGHAERSAWEATARIEAREAALAAREAGVQQRESDLEDRHRSAAELDLIKGGRAVLNADEEGLRAAESDWWAKQLGPPLSAKK